MFVGVKHKIENTEKFWSVAKQELSKLPAGITLVSSVANKEGNSAFCLWEVNSVKTLKNFMEARFGSPLSINEYFEVDPSKSINLPTPALR
ncbi:MAG: hypothetical protein HY611_06030 [Elusimicrobia bacterium]|nr:hypothetical protein [Elusimicrobiota bacterium]